MFQVGASGLSLCAWCHRSVQLAGRRAQCLWDDQSVAVHAAPVPEKNVAVAAMLVARIARVVYSGAIGLREDGSKRVIIGRPFALPAELGTMPPPTSLGNVPTMEGVVPPHALSFSTASLHIDPSVCTAAAAAAFCNLLPFRGGGGTQASMGISIGEGLPPVPQQISRQDQEVGVH